jgi:hypothetical protein
VNSRRAGYAGESQARALLASRDWSDIQRRSAGERGDDFKATDPHAVRWSIEVKSVKVADVGRFLKQARANCGPLPWMLMLHVKGIQTSDWLVFRNRGTGNRWEVWR